MMVMMMRLMVPRRIIGFPARYVRRDGAREGRWRRRRGRVGIGFPGSVRGQRMNQDGVGLGLSLGLDESKKPFPET